MGTRKSILIVDDHEIVSEGIASIMSGLNVDDCERVASAAEALEKTGTRSFDIVIVDLELPGTGGLELIRTIKEIGASVRILVYTMHEEVWALRDIEEAHPDGIVFKSEEPALLTEAVSALSEGRTYQSPRYRQLHDSAKHDSLGYSASRILALLAEGLSSKQIAEKVFLSENTIEYHRKRMMRHFNATNTAQLILRATRQGYLRP